MSVKFFEIGSLNLKKDKKGKSIQLGVNSKNAKYNYTVDVRVRDSEGNVVATVTNPFLALKDPRIGNDGQPSKFADQIPDFILNKLVLVVDDEKTS